MSLLDIRGLSLAIGDTPILNGIDLEVAPGEVVGLVGESGSGKSMTALAIMRLLPRAARASGRVRFGETDLLSATEDQMCLLRGDDIGMVFQEPMTALNPVKTIGEQVAEGIRWHTGASRAEAEERARAILDRVGLPGSKFPLSRYPHQLSGGQRQRVVIAIACALRPRLLIADEPTTALDVVLQSQILDLLRDLVAENRMGLLLISHDLAVVADMADRVTIIRAGEIMETGETARTLTAQAHPYTRQLAHASVHVPARRPAAPPGRIEGQPPSTSASQSPPPDARSRTRANPPARASAEQGVAPTGGRDRPADFWTGEQLLEVDSVCRDYPGDRTSLFSRPAPVRAVDNVSFSLSRGESVALVGRSGCGKSTLARLILALDRPTAGKISFLGGVITDAPHSALRLARRNMQVVFQDPYGSFDPRYKVERLVAEPLHLLEDRPNRSLRREMVARALHEVGLEESDMDKYPHEFSGGQRQRLSIARAIITRPKLVVADEPVSALDVSIRAQVLDLFADLNQRLGVAYLFITHDLTVARAITDRVLVMHEGQIVERGLTAEVLEHPRSEAAKALVAAAPDLERAIRRRLSAVG